MSRHSGASRSRLDARALGCRRCGTRPRPGGFEGESGGLREDSDEFFLHCEEVLGRGVEAVVKLGRLWFQVANLLGRRQRLLQPDQHSTLEVQERSERVGQLRSGLGSAYAVAQIEHAAVQRRPFAGQVRREADHVPCQRQQAHSVVHDLLLTRPPSRWADGSGRRTSPSGV